MEFFLVGRDSCFIFVELEKWCSVYELEKFLLIKNSAVEFHYCRKLEACYLVFTTTEYLKSELCGFE